MPSSLQKANRSRRLLQEQMRELCTRPLMRGSVVKLRRRCGKASCACSKNPDVRHEGTFLSVHLDGKTRTLYLRPEDEEDIRQAIATYDELWSIINQLTALEFGERKRLARERRRSKRRRRG